MPYEIHCMTPLKKIILLVNPAAGKGRAAAICSQIRDALKKHGISFEEFSDNWPPRIENVDGVFVVGGDGTLNHFINLYPDLTIPIALFKGGSGNDFAWKLYGNISVEQYLERVIRQNFIYIDAGKCNDRIFLNGFGLGFDGAIVKAMGSNRRISAGHFAYLFTVIRKVLFYKEKMVSFTFDGLSSTESIFMLAIANGPRYGGGFYIAPQAKMDDGKLDLILIKEIPPLKRVLKIPLVQKGKHLKLSIVQHRLIDSIQIANKENLPAHCDGELMEATSFTIQIQPHKYRFLV